MKTKRKGFATFIRKIEGTVDEVEPQGTVRSDGCQYYDLLEAYINYKRLVHGCTGSYAQAWCRYLELLEDYDDKEEVHAAIATDYREREEGYSIW